MNMMGEGDFVEESESNPTQQNQPSHRSQRAAPAQSQQQPGVSPDDVEFNLLAGNQFDPNLISDEERKMIEQALRESEQQEHAVRESVMQAPQNVSNSAVQRSRAVISEHQEQLQDVSGVSSLRRGPKPNQSVEQVDKDKGNK